MTRSLVSGLCGAGLLLLACSGTGDDSNNPSDGGRGGKGGASSASGGTGAKSGTNGGSTAAGGSASGTGGRSNAGGSTASSGGTRASGGNSSSGSGGTPSGEAGTSNNSAGASGSAGTTSVNTLCAPHPEYKKCQATDFSKEDIFNNSKWDITTWSSPNRTHSTDNLWVENGALVMKVNGGTPPGQQTTGAEIISTKTDFLYGSFRVLIKTATESGTVNGFFYYLNDQSEIDVEVLSRDNSKQLIYYTIHENNDGANTHKVYNAGFDPSAAYHEYRFDWTADDVKYYVDGKHTATLPGNTPYQRGRIMLNHWTLSDPAWGGGPPKNDAFMYVKHIELYFN